MNEYRDASNRLTFDFDQIEAKAYSYVTEAIVTQFNLAPVGRITRGLDEIFQDYQLGDKLIGLEWDNWSGYIVCAKSKDAEPMAKEIASYIDSIFSS